MTDLIPSQFRNSGYSMGLEYPFIYNMEHEGVRWRVWNRDTGEIHSFVDEKFPILNENRAYRKACELNGLNPNVCDFAAIDSTP